MRSLEIEDAINSGLKLSRQTVQPAYDHGLEIEDAINSGLKRDHLLGFIGFGLP